MIIPSPPLLLGLHLLFQSQVWARVQVPARVPTSLQVRALEAEVVALHPSKGSLSLSLFLSLSLSLLHRLLTREPVCCLDSQQLTRKIGSQRVRSDSPPQIISCINANDIDIPFEFRFGTLSQFPEDEVMTLVKGGSGIVYYIETYLFDLSFFLSSLFPSLFSLLLKANGKKKKKRAYAGQVIGTVMRTSKRSNTFFDDVVTSFLPLSVVPRVCRIITLCTLFSSLLFFSSLTRLLPFQRRRTQHEKGNKIVRDVVRALELRRYWDCVGCTPHL